MIILAMALAAAFPALKPGATVTLGEGPYAFVEIRQQAFDPPVTINAGKAVIEGLRIWDSSGIVWRGGTIKSPLGRDNRKPDGYGVNVRRSHNIVFDGATISDAYRAMVVGDSDDVKVRNSNFTDLRSDGINMAGVTNVVIENNRFTNFDPVKATGTKAAGDWKDGDHPDAIQFWTTPTTPYARDIVIRGNHIDGITQGINFFGPTRDGYTRVRIENNDVQVSYPAAITLVNCSDCAIRFNTVNPRPESRFKANIRTQETSAIVCDNIMPATPDHKATTRCKTR